MSIYSLIDYVEKLKLNFCDKYGVYPKYIVLPYELYQSYIDSFSEILINPKKFTTFLGLELINSVAANNIYLL